MLIKSRYAVEKGHMNRKKAKDEDDAFELALRVLSAWNRGRVPAESDVVALKKAFPSFVFEAPDGLACHAINTLRPHVLRRSAKRAS